MFKYPHKLEKLINEISRLPGIGPKMAERIAMSIIKKDNIYLDNFKDILDEVKTLQFCERCFNVSDNNLCTICSDDQRNDEIICVVESPEDVITVEKTSKHKGYYHILHGVLNPLNNILPENLKLYELSDRLKKDDKIREIILAINHTVEGDATSLYIVNIVKELHKNIKISRIAKGLPTGSDIRYADEVTLGQAILERKEI